VPTVNEEALLNGFLCNVNNSWIIGKPLFDASKAVHRFLLLDANKPFIFARFYICFYICFCFSIRVCVCVCFCFFSLVCYISRFGWSHKRLLLLQTGNAKKPKKTKSIFQHFKPNRKKRESLFWRQNLIDYFLVSRIWNFGWIVSFSKIHATYVQSDINRHGIL